MSDLLLAGQVAGVTGRTVRLTVIVDSDFRDERGFVPPPVYLLESIGGGAWQAYGGGPAIVIGSSVPGVAPVATCTYVTTLPGLPPFARTVRRRVYENTDTPGVWDWTVPDSAAPVWTGTPAPAPTVSVLPGAGPKGDSGAAMLHGSLDPAPEVGSPDDLFLNTVTLDLFAKSGGAWALSANLRGGSGGRGPQGTPGAKGDGFLKPSPAQLGFLPVADDSQPFGFSWYSKLSLGIRDTFLSLGDVDGDTFAVNILYGLRLNSQSGKIEAVELGTGGPDEPPVPGAGVAGYGTALSFTRTPEADGARVAGDIENKRLMAVPASGTDQRFPVYRITLPADHFLRVFADHPIEIRPATPGAMWTRYENGAWNGGGIVAELFSLAPGEYYVRMDNPASVGYMIFNYFVNAVDSYNTSPGGFYYGNLNDNSPELAGAYISDDGIGSTFRFRSEYPLEKGSSYITVLKPLSPMTVELHELANSYDESGVVIWTQVIPADGQFHIVQTAVTPAFGSYAFAVAGQGRVFAPVDVAPGIGTANRNADRLNLILADDPGEVARGHAGIIATDHGPRMLLRGQGGEAQTLGADMPLTTDLDAAAAPFVGILDNGTDPPRMAVKRLDGSKWYGPAFLTVP